MSISRETLAKYVTPGCIFVESGTRWGDTAINALRLGAHAVITVERDALMAAIAEAHIADAVPGSAWRVKVLRGDSSAMLADSINRRDTIEDMRKCDTVVFLDAHDDRGSAMMGELESLVGCVFKPDTILVDDRRCWAGWGIQLEQVVAAIDKLGKYQISYDDGVEKEDILVARRIV